MTRKKVKAPAEMTIGELTDALFNNREELRAVSKAERDLKGEKEELQEALIMALDHQDSTRGAGKLASASISEAMMTNVVDWDKFHAWLRKNNRLYFLERRPAQAICREYINMESRGAKAPPGTETFNKRSISLRALD
jgi:hypothetical protein